MISEYEISATLVSAVTFTIWISLARAAVCKDGQGLDYIARF